MFLWFIQFLQQNRAPNFSRTFSPTHQMDSTVVTFELCAVGVVDVVVAVVAVADAVDVRGVDVDVDANRIHLRQTDFDSGHVG